MARWSFLDSGSPKTESFLANLLRSTSKVNLDKYGRRGVAALSAATPKESGVTANSWEYRVTNNSIEWYNTNVVDGVNIAIILQYGHATGTGGYVRGYDYINPAIRPVMDEIADEVWREVTSG